MTQQTERPVQLYLKDQAGETWVATLTRAEAVWLHQQLSAYLAETPPNEAAEKPREQARWEDDGGPG